MDREILGWQGYGGLVAPSVVAFAALKIKRGAKWVYIELRKQFDYRKGGDNHLILPYSKVTWRMNRSTFSKKNPGTNKLWIHKKSQTWRTF